MNAAKENKEKVERQWKEKIGSGAHWKYKMTIPQAPKLAKANKSKESNQPLSLMDTLNKNPSVSTTSFKRHQNYPQTMMAEEVANTQSQAKLLMKKKSKKDKELITLDPKCDYEQAQWVIHSHILSLEV